MFLIEHSGSGVVFMRVKQAAQGPVGALGVPVLGVLGVLVLGVLGVLVTELLQPFGRHYRIRGQGGDLFFEAKQASRWFRLLHLRYGCTLGPGSVVEFHPI